MTLMDRLGKEDGKKWKKMGKNIQHLLLTFSCFFSHYCSLLSWEQWILQSYALNSIWYYQ